MTAIPPPDESAHLDSLLMAQVASINTELGRYVLRFLDTDAGRVAPLPVEDERALAERVGALANGIRVRAARRDQLGEPPRLVTTAISEAADG